MKPFTAPSLLCASSLIFWAGTTCAEVPEVRHPSSEPTVTASDGVRFQELIGRGAAPGARSDRASIALFHLEPGRGSAWSHNKTGEESFFVISGHGEVWTDGHRQAIGPGDYILIPPAVVRSIRASSGEALEYYAITAPAWSQDDDVLSPAPKTLPR